MTCIRISLDYKHITHSLLINTVDYIVSIESYTIRSVIILCQRSISGRSPVILGVILLCQQIGSCQVGKPSHYSRQGRVALSRKYEKNAVAPPRVTSASDIGIELIDLKACHFIMQCSKRCIQYVIPFQCYMNRTAVA